MCGHDTHSAMLLGAAAILKEMEPGLKGTVKLMFQTGEECGCGARLMTEAGIMDNPTVDAAFAIHIDSRTDVGHRIGKTCYGHFNLPSELPYKTDS